jgi:hypothetical protein
VSRKLFALAFSLLALAASPYLSAQTIRQEESQPLFPPSLISTGDGTGNSVLLGFSIASIKSIPFSATIEAESQSVDTNGNNTIRRRITKIARDAKGRTRIDTDQNPVGAPTDLRLVGVHIYDAVAKTETTLFPWSHYAICLQYEDHSPPDLDDLLPPPPPPPTAPNPAVAPNNLLLKPIAIKQLRARRAQQSQPRINNQREELGLEVIDGMPLRHGRQTSRYPAGSAGFKVPQTVVIDYWYSQELQSFVLVKQLGPFNSVHTLTLHNIRRENPDLSLFTIPKDYKVDHVHMEPPKTVYVL